METYAINKLVYANDNTSIINNTFRLDNNYIYEIIDSKLERRDRKYKADKWKSAIKRRKRYL